MHTFRVHTSLLITLGGALILSATGCEDSASKQRDQVQAQLTQIRSDLQKTLATGGESYEADLNKIVGDLSSVTGGEPGQQSAKSLMAANALREVAMVHTDKAAAIEAKHRDALGWANARIEAALRLASLASGLETIDAAKRRSELQAELQTALEGVTAAQAKMAELSSPINERTSQNTSQKAEIERLRVQVGELLKEANLRGYSAGFETYKQATQVGRQADKIEYEVSNREIDLEHDLNPQHKSAERQKAQLEALGQAIELAQTELDAFAKAASGDAQASRAKAAELSKQVADSLAEIKATADGELKAAYDEGLAALEKASTNARSAAAGGRDAAAGKTLGVAVNESIVRLHLFAAHGLADRAATLQRIKMSNGAIAMSGVDAQIKELADARQLHLDAAKTALDEATQEAQSIAGAGSEITALQTNLQHLSDVLAGKGAAAAPDRGPGTAGGDNSAAAVPTIPPGSGAESPEALVEALKSIKTVSDAGRIFDLGLPPTDAKMQPVVQSIRSAITATGALDAALNEKFGKGLSAMKNNDIGGDMPTVSDAVIEDQAETSGTIKVTNTKGETSNLPICKVSDRWFIGSPNDNGAGVFSAMGMGEMTGANNPQMTPEMKQMAMGMLAGMSPMFDAIGGLMGELAAGVQNGDFATFEDFEVAADAKMKAITSGLGLPGGAGAAGGGDPNK